jgi:hypothetical protein
MRLRKRSAAAIVAAGVAASLVAPAAMAAVPSGGCAQGQVVEALQVRALHSRLMVAALSCQAETEFNTFVRRFDHVLTRSGRQMADWFAPRGGRRALNDYVTSLANKASLDSMSDRFGFCRAAHDLFAQAGKMDDAGLVALSRTRPRAEAETADVCL